MIVLNKNNIVAFDVDETLVYWINSENSNTESYHIKYGDEWIWLNPHKSHIRFLKHCKNRGDHVVVWSQNGFEHAEAVVKVLNLEKYVDVVMAKPTRHVDDKEDVTSIVGNRIFIKE